MTSGSSLASSFTRRRMNDEQCEAPHILCNSKGCDFFLWYDSEPSERSKIIINELKKNNNKLKLEISELKKCTSYEDRVEYKDVLDDGNNNHIIMQLSDEICSLNRKFRVAIVVVVCTWIVIMSMWLM
ncbi:hypothetical protein ZIOFF_039084 [Zingiber officinale]|uniref:Uncharacterized protein n=1 Tax=Zingiber officinale TaxID=94328 RepID=A0A8J5G2P2_ZINOF|nr:hypothetical protein ZIOFF_039084 [Zingiber officinale]